MDLSKNNGSARDQGMMQRVLSALAHECSGSAIWWIGLILAFGTLFLLHQQLKVDQGW